MNIVIFVIEMRFFLFVILLLHVNYTMFIAQVDEIDLYDAKGQQIEDINSLTEYVDVVLFGNKHKHKADDDDDCARFFHSIKIDYFFKQQLVATKNVDKEIGAKKVYPVYSIGKPSSAYTEIQTPPPEA
ncbi:MAG: hypothetical protein C4330_02055 [Chitinophagaceae bacterium]